MDEEQQDPMPHPSPAQEKLTMPSDESDAITPEQKAKEAPRQNEDAQVHTEPGEQLAGA
jgi:hypothetical protein